MDTSTFLKRSLIFQAELQRNSYPNASTLADLCDCSRSTAVRTIDRLRYEFGVPIEYDESNRGYYLTKSDFSFASLPPGRDELVVMILLGELLHMIDDSSLKSAVSSLWAHLTNGRSDVHYDLEQIRNRFSSETTSVAKLADVDLLRLLDLSHKGQPVAVRYRSPWRHEEDKEYIGLFERFHFSDGILYAMFEDQSGRHLVLNVSFVKELKEVDSLPPRPAPPQSSAHHTDHHWLEGFGVWSGAEPLTIEVAILPPASRYYAAQTWHPAQEDLWDGEILIRRFPGVPSPELNRRILSLGRFVHSVKPESILQDLARDVAHLGAVCGGTMKA
jgi:predicted DNA-binding transcriptional regulator YafY